MESLPLELVRQILLHVSTASLVASARLVCRSWKAIIDDDPSFARDQLPFSTSGYLLRHCKSSWARPAGPSASLFTYISSSSSRFAWSKRTERLSDDYSIMQSCDGLLLVVSCDENLPAYICNPLLGEWTALPPDDSKPKIACYSDAGVKIRCHSGFGFDASTKRYKVFRMRYHGKNLDESNLVCEFCTVGGQQPPAGWRRTSGAVGRKLSHRHGGVLVSNRLHWLPDLHSVNEDEEQRDGCTIVSLDVGTESFAEVRGPRNVTSFRNACIMSVGGYLALHVRRQYPTRGEIWVMKEYGKVESWTMEYNTPDVDSSSIISPCGPWRGRSLLYRMHKKYNFCGNWRYLSHDCTADHEEEVYMGSFHDFTPCELLQYTPSLVSLRRRCKRKRCEMDRC